MHPAGTTCIQIAVNTKQRCQTGFCMDGPHRLYISPSVATVLHSKPTQQRRGVTQGCFMLCKPSGRGVGGGQGGLKIEGGRGRKEG